MRECVTHHYACDCREEIFKELEKDNKQLRQKLDAEKWARRVMLRQIIAIAGYPDAVQACRNIIQHCKKMLGDSNSQIDDHIKVSK